MQQLQLLGDLGLPIDIERPTVHVAWANHNIHCSLDYDGRYNQPRLSTYTVPWQNPVHSRTYGKNSHVECSTLLDVLHAGCLQLEDDELQTIDPEPPGEGYVHERYIGLELEMCVSGIPIQARLWVTAARSMIISFNHNAPNIDDMSQIICDHVTIPSSLEDALMFILPFIHEGVERHKQGFRGRLDL